MRKSLLIMASLALSVSAVAFAQNTGGVRYKWYDGHGLMHYSDSLSTEALKYGYEVVNDRGIVVRHVPRQLNAEERAAAAKIAATQATKQRAEQELANTETQMLNAYPDEASYRISLQQTLDTIDQQIRTTQINLRSQEKSLADLLGRAAEIESSKKPVPKFLTDSIATQRNVVTGLRTTQQRQKALRAQTVQEQVTQLARYRVLKAEHDKASQ